MKHSKTHELVVSKLRDKGIIDLHRGVQLFTDQYSDYYSVSVGYNGTGIRIPKKDVTPQDLYEDEMIWICKTWEYKEK